MMVLHLHPHVPLAAVANSDELCKDHVKDMA